MAKATIQGLTGRELLEKTYSALVEQAGIKTIKLKTILLQEIADDSDWHRTRKGYMRYESLDLIKLDRAWWCIGNGKKSGSYPAERYDSDIIAVKINKTNTPYVIERVASSRYFENSPVYAMADGNLCIGKGFKDDMLERLRPKIEQYIAQNPEYDSQYLLLSTLQHPVTKHMLYKPEFAGFIAKTIEDVLKRGD
jgi:hypothetical protein